MNYRAFTDDALLLMHRAVLGALAVDDELIQLGREAKFRVRETPDWLGHAAELESEMRRRGMSFDAIKWSEDRTSRPHLADIPTLTGVDSVPKDRTSMGEGQNVENAALLRKRIAVMLRRRFRVVSNEVSAALKDDVR